MNSIKPGEIYSVSDVDESYIWSAPFTSSHIEGQCRVMRSLKYSDVVFVIALISSWHPRRNGRWCLVLCHGPTIGWISSKCLDVK